MLTVKNTVPKIFRRVKRGEKLTDARLLSMTALLVSHPQSSKNQTQQVLHCLLSTVETHMASQPNLLKQDHGPYCVIAFYLSHPPPSKFQWQWEGS